MANTLSLVLIITFSFSASISAAPGKKNPGVDFSVNIKAPQSENRFVTDIGTRNALTAMDNSTDFVKHQLGAYRTETKVVLVIQDMYKVANTAGNQINVSAGYIQRYQGNVLKEFKGILFSEMTRVWLLNSGGAPEIVVSGIADYMRLKAGYEPASGWVKKQGGSMWNESSNVTARFFAFCEYLTPKFVRGLSTELSYNKKFDIYAFFGSYFGQKLEQMWVYYKNGHVPP